MPLSTKFDEALVFASKLHRDQLRKGTTTPYISHLMSVAALVLEHDGDEEQAIAALLHDSIEDKSEEFGGRDQLAAEIARRFGPEVLRIVEACTKVEMPTSIESKRAYVASLPGKDSRAALVTAADKLHNARAIVADIQKEGAAVFKRFNGSREDTLWYYRALADGLVRHHPGTLAFELDRTVREMVRQAQD